MGQWVFGRVPGSIKSALSGVRTKYPDIRISNIMNAPVLLLKYSSIKEGPMGACVDMLYLSSCNEEDCTYKHPSTRLNLNPSKAATAARQPKAGYTAYMAK